MIPFVSQSNSLLVYSKNLAYNGINAKKMVVIQAFGGLKGVVGDEKQEKSDEVKYASVQKHLWLDLPLVLKRTVSWLRFYISGSSNGTMNLF